MPFSHDSSKFDVNDEGKATRRKDKHEAHAYELSGKATDLERTEFIMQVQNIMDVLRFYPSRSEIWRDGECITRDLLTLMELILQGKSREEIVKYFEYSTGSVGVMFENLRKVPEIEELKLMVPGTKY